MLTRENHGYVTKETYTSGNDLQARAKKAIDENADIFLSIHFNNTKEPPTVPQYT